MYVYVFFPDNYMQEVTTFLEIVTNYFGRICLQDFEQYSDLETRLSCKVKGPVACNTHTHTHTRTHT